MFAKLLAGINFKLYMAQMIMSKEDMRIMIKEVRSTLDRIEGEMNDI